MTSTKKTAQVMRLSCGLPVVGNEGVVEALLRRSDVNPKKPDKCGRTPLCCAAWNGHEGVVKILLRRGEVNPDKPENHGQTPLCSAA